MRTKKNNARPKGARQAIRTFTIDHWIKGYSYREIQKKIADQFDYNSSLMTISRDVKVVIEEWRETRLTHVEELKAIELQRINKLEKTYWEAWERSLAGTQRTSEKQKATANITVDGAKTMVPYMGEKSTSREETYGDPRFLAGVQWCIMQRCKILAIEQPPENNFNQINNVQVNQVVKFSVKKRPRPIE